jgi:transaldolase/glucose-6-phosphate isomerase
MLNSMELSLPSDLQYSLDQETALFAGNSVVERIWKKDPSVWTGSGEDKWLGWLDIAERELGSPAKYAGFAESASKFGNIVLLGMGGSSLCPDVLSKVFGKDRFKVLDSTVPDQIKTLEDSIDIADTLFIVASKSGTTLEPNIFLQYFYDKVSKALGSGQAGDRFVAITDPGSKLEDTAGSDGFHRAFFGDPEVGGRFSALSAFGVAPACAMSLDHEEILRNAKKMADACRTPDVAENPGALLGCVLGMAWKKGRDKLEILASPSVVTFGAWLEQLIAESTGKNSKAIIPIDRRGNVAFSSETDRVFVYLRDGNSPAGAEERFADELRSMGEALITVDMSDRSRIGAEFFRWEFATAVAGSIMGINPFDQPDVEAAKIEARKLTDEVEKTGRLPEETAFLSDKGFKFFTDTANQRSIGVNDSADACIREHFSRLKSGDYAAVLAYIEMNDEHIEILESIRTKLIWLHGVSTTVQFGPRFLHSTGQAFKGGPDTGVFLQITSDDGVDLAVPGKSYTFGTVKAAQSRGDFQVLLDRGRRALRIHIEGDTAEGLRKLELMIA